jgi:hypothetical protein
MILAHSAGAWSAARLAATNQQMEHKSTLNALGHGQGCIDWPLGQT